jgi:hypothetical protein
MCVAQGNVGNRQWRTVSKRGIRMVGKFNQHAKNLRNCRTSKKQTSKTNKYIYISLPVDHLFTPSVKQSTDLQNFAAKWMLADLLKEAGGRGKEERQLSKS